jgi:hypothetical protein
MKPVNRQETRFRVGPGADGGLEDFHPRPDHVENHDGGGFVPTLQARGQKHDLDRHGADDERIIAGERRGGGIPEMGGDDHGQH